MDSSMRNSIYMTPSAGLDARVADLMGRMTVQEKVGQLTQLLGTKMYRRKADGVEVTDDFRKAVTVGLVGAIYGLLRADPWTKVTLKTGLAPDLAPGAVNILQRFAIENTRLGIPLLLSEECPHGHMAIGTTVFPTALGQACTFNPELIERMARVIATETRAMGGNVGYGPILDVAQDPRWSRVEETYGEDPHLIAQMGQAMVRGLQGAGLSQPDAVLSTLKHLAAYAQTEGGHNGGAAHVGMIELHQMLLEGFRQCVAAGAKSVMTSYNEIDGVPCTANANLLIDVLRKQWGFDGFVVSDLYSIDILTQQGQANDLQQAAAISLEAGVDSDLGGNAFAAPLLAALEKGHASTASLDRAVAAILRSKFQLGLFDNPYVKPERAVEIVACKEHRELAREVARQSIILLKNDGDTLPISADIKSIAVIGPNADNVYNQLGDYTAPQLPGQTVTVLEGIRRRVGPTTEVHYAKGCAIRDTSTAGFAEAIAAAKKSQLAVVVLGGSSARDFSICHDDTGAAKISSDATKDMECGEGYDRCELNIAGVQLQLLEEIQRTGVPVVAVLIKGRPLIVTEVLAHSNAVLDAWYPGGEGGAAVADVLFGDYNPAGRLPISVPKSVGQLPVYYYHKPNARRRYIEMDCQPELAFGFGLSYTKFAYSDLQITPAAVPVGGSVKVAVTLTNTGPRGGDEVVQCYIRDPKASITQPVQVLKAFRRVSLASQASCIVEFTISPQEMSLVGADLKRHVEAGRFEIMVGGSSQDTPCRETFQVTP